MVKVGEKYKRIIGELANSIVVIVGETPKQLNTYRTFNINSKHSGNCTKKYLLEDCEYLGLASLSEFLEAKGETYESVANYVVERSAVVGDHKDVIKFLRGAISFTRIYEVYCSDYLGLDISDLVEMIMLDKDKLDVKPNTVVIWCWDESGNIDNECKASVIKFFNENKINKGEKTMAEYEFNYDKVKSEYRKEQTEHDPERILEDLNILDSRGYFTGYVLSVEIRKLLERKGLGCSVENIKKVFNEYVIRDYESSTIEE